MNTKNIKPGMYLASYRNSSKLEVVEVIAHNEGNLQPELRVARLGTGFMFYIDHYKFFRRLRIKELQEQETANGKT